MKQAKTKKGFTLAEVMVVLLVITILFAAFAPVITKRRKNSSVKQEVWMWASRNYLAGPMNIYYKPVSDSYQGGIYIGTTPDSENEIKSSYVPVSKLVIRSGYILNNVIQRQLQLRYGRNYYDDPGQLAGTFIADGTNLLFGGIYPYHEQKCSDSTYPKGNIAFGYYSMNAIHDSRYNSYNKNCDPNTNDVAAENNTAFGYNALSKINSAKDNTAIGSGAGATISSPYHNQNTFIGYNAGNKANSSSNTLIGYNSQALQADYNTFIGADTGNAERNTNYPSWAYQYNVALGYKALSSINSGAYNVAIGSGALSNLEHGHYNVAIGYNACFGLKAQSNKTCIGAWSGPANNSPVFNELNIKNEAIIRSNGDIQIDDTQRTYIGANPNIDSSGNWNFSGKYGGDAVLEIYNSKGEGNNKLINNPQITSNATTIINGNLIVRGKTYLTMGSILYPFYYQNNILGTNANVSCASDQITYDFSTSGNCAELLPIASDRRLKNITAKNDNGLEKIKQLKVYNFIFKNDKNKEKHVGVIAQELQKIFPNSVFTDNNGYLKIKTDEIFYAIINAIKELNNKIVYLINKTSVFEKKITDMEKENKDLKNKINELSLKIEAVKNKH